MDHSLARLEELSGRPWGSRAAFDGITVTPGRTSSAVIQTQPYPVVAVERHAALFLGSRPEPVPHGGRMLSWMYSNYSTIHLTSCRFPRPSPFEKSGFWRVASSPQRQPLLSFCPFSPLSSLLPRLAGFPQGGRRRDKTALDRRSCGLTKPGAHEPSLGISDVTRCLR